MPTTRDEALGTSGSARRLLVLALVLVGVCAPLARGPRDEVPERLFVDAEKGRDKNRGDARRPLRTLSAALALLVEPLEHSVTIELRGRHEGTGTVGMPANALQLARRMRPGVVVTILGVRDEEGAPPVLAWEGEPLVDVREGDWSIEDVRIGDDSPRQRAGIEVVGPAHATLRDVVIRTRSHSGAGILVRRAGRVSLRGAIRLNEHLHDEAPEDSFCGIVATDHGTVKFVEREGASLDMGNGSLSASYYGSVRLGCETARITSWGRQSNNLAVNDSGRVDLHSTTTTLRARVPENTPIGPEHDGHILAEDAHIIIEGTNECAVTLQKASTFFCNDIELRGEFRKALWVMSGSTFVGGFIGDVRQVEAHSGAVVHLTRVTGELKGPTIVTSGGTLSLPDGRVLRGGESR